MFSQLRTFQRNSRYERWRCRIFFITWLSYGSFYFTRKGFSVAKVELLKPEVMGMSKIELSWIDGAYLVSYAIGQFVWGMCGDRFGTRRVIQAGMMASILVAMAMGASSTTWMFGTLFCIQGICQSSGWAPLNKNMGEFFSRRERGRVMGFWCTNYPLFGFLASVLAGWSISYYGSWPYAFWVPASILFMVWILFLLLQRNRPEDIGLPSIEFYHGDDAIPAEREATTKEAHDGVAGTWKIIQDVFTNRIVWLLGAVYFLLKPTRYLVLFWSPVYIHERLNTSAYESGTISAIFDLAGPLGAITGG
ncbi:MAG: MFS transporter, partial [Pirellulales bacterium]|nr:MFS transporter [Pirellulales bacterium]